MTLAIEALTFGYRRTEPILREVSAAFEPGRVAAILGPNGAGKSTLLRAALGFVKPWSGRVTLGARDIRSLPGAERVARLAYVPQRPEVAGAFTARRVVALGRHALPARDDLVEHALVSLELDRFSDRPFATLSVGQQQRVALARALAQLGALDDAEPLVGKTLLADEPMSAMDPRFVGIAASHMRRLARRGATVVVGLHDATTALRLADDVLALSCDGRVAARGPTERTLTAGMLESLYGTRFDTIRQDGRGALLPSLPGARDDRPGE